MKLIERVLSKDNLNKAYIQVTRNKGACGIDNMTCNEVLQYLKVHGNKLRNQILSREYQPLPVRRVEIPKPNGGIRKLGVPTVVDRIIQQALVQELTPIFEPTFSEYSYGFRPNRSCHDAIERVLGLINEGYEWIVDIDLEKFFDNVPHDKLIRIVDNAVQDSDVTSLVMKYLHAGVIDKGVFERTTKGTPQGGNLSPLLSNVLLNVLDKELERRGLNFARYADDLVIAVRKEQSANRVMRNTIKFIENKLHLKVNATKSHVTKPNNLKYLGFSFWYNEKEETWLSKPHGTSFISLKRKLKRLTSRSWSIDLTTRIKIINRTVMGWINYYKIGSMKVRLSSITKWLRRRIRVVIWKQWKTVSNRIKSLIKLGLCKDEATAISNSRKKYVRIARSWSLHKSITNKRLKERGLINPLEYYLLKIT